MYNTNPVERIGRIILRTPVLPLKNIYSPVNIGELIQDQVFLSALFLASPVLYEEAIRYKNGKIYSEKGQRKIEESLTKYYLRMSSRCTPFGLFSACGSIEQCKDSADNIILPPLSKLKRCSRLDMNYICALSLYISNLPEVILEFKFYSNSSLYSMGGKWRYVEYYYSSGNRIHQISSVDQDSLINKIIKTGNTGVSFNDVSNIIKKEGIECSEEDVLEYFKDLINSKILISEVEPSITGNDFLNAIIDKLNIIKTDRIIELRNILFQTKTLLNLADKQEPSENLVNIYKKITSILKNIDIEIDESKLFQVDSFWNFDEGQFLDHQLYSDVDTAVEVLQKISTPYKNENLISFAQRFTERYEEQEVPLMQVLDTESGIGYLQDGKNRNNADRSIQWGSRQALLYEKMQKCLLKNKSEVILDEKDIEALKPDQPNTFAPSFNALCRIVQKDKKSDNHILIENVGGSSTANLLGRFTYNDPQILNHVKNICNVEESLNSDVIFAEIVHLPQSRVGNILLHPPFRKSEIPYLSLSSVPIDNQILLEDLLISIKHNKVLLRSKKLNKIIIPRLSNAHSYSMGSQPIYHFLCDLQFQDVTPWFSFGWEDLAKFNKILPRIVYKNIILQPAMWNLNNNDIKKYLSNTDNNQHQNFKNFCSDFKIPDFFLLTDADNDLPINTKDDLHIDIFINTTKNKKNIVLKEFLPSSNIIRDENENTYNNQIAISYIKKDKTYIKTKLIHNKKSRRQARRSFNQNSEWVYFKIYCGVKTSNDILRNCISTCVKKLKKEKLIDSWFFIRYADPHHHIRIRFHIKENLSFSKEQVISKLMNSIKYYEKNGLIWNITMDTYKREIERYRDIIEYAETLFSFDSDATVTYLQHNTEDDASWWKYGFKAIDESFSDFNLNLNERQRVISTLCTSFNKEFQVGKTEKSKLDSLYRDRYKEIYNLIENNDNIEINNILAKKSRISKKIIQESFSQFSSEEVKKERIFEFMLSYIHMLMNRLCMTNPRQEEMILYNLILKYYTSKIGRIKHSA